MALTFAQKLQREAWIVDQYKAHYTFREIAASLEITPEAVRQIVLRVNPKAFDRPVLEPPREIVGRHNGQYHSISPTDYAEIYRKWAEERISQVTLAQQYGAGQSTISKIIREERQKNE